MKQTRQAVHAIKQSTYILRCLCFQVYAYGRNSNLTKMFEKSNLCRQILKIYDVVSPGTSKERALTQFELYYAEKQIFKQGPMS
jgi:hypothetical protein